MGSLLKESGSFGDFSGYRREKPLLICPVLRFLEVGYIKPLTVFRRREFFKNRGVECLKVGERSGVGLCCVVVTKPAWLVCLGVLPGVDTCYAGYHRAGSTASSLTVDGFMVFSSAVGKGDGSAVKPHSTLKVKVFSSLQPTKPWRRGRGTPLHTSPCASGYEDNHIALLPVGWYSAPL